MPESVEPAPSTISTTFQFAPPPTTHPKPTRPQLRPPTARRMKEIMCRAFICDIRLCGKCCGSTRTHFKTLPYYAASFSAARPIRHLIVFPIRFRLRIVSLATNTTRLANEHSFESGSPPHYKYAPFLGPATDTC